MNKHKYNKAWKIFGIVTTTILFLALPHIIDINIPNYLLADLIISALLCIIWRFWWLWPIVSGLGMLIYLIIVSDWSPIESHPEEIYAWFLCIEAYVAGLLGSAVGYLMNRFCCYIIMVLKKSNEKKERQ